VVIRSKGPYLHTTHKATNTTDNICINVTFKRVGVTAVEVVKQVLQILCVCVCLAFVIQHAIGMRHIVICGLSDSYHIFSLYLINGMIFGREVTGQ
jgi:hypothetical protein